jgi:lysozyme
VLDLSNNNSLSWAPAAYNFQKAYKSGQRRAYFKATEGRSFVDKRTPALERKAREAGFLTGWYHFANDWDQNPLLQADHFLKNIPYSSHLVPVLDMEQGAPSKDKGSWARRFIKEVQRLRGGQVGVYGSSWYLQTCFSGGEVPGPLWVAAVGAGGGPLDYSHVQIPPPWDMSNVAAHQYTWKGNVPGVPGSVDVSRPIHINLLDRP